MREGVVGLSIVAALSIRALEWLRDRVLSAVKYLSGATPTPGPSVDTTAVLKDLVQVLADKTNSKKAAKNKSSKRAKGGNTTTDTSSSSDSDDGGREDPIPQPLQHPYGKGSYDCETDNLFTQDGELSFKTFKS